MSLGAAKSWLSPNAYSSYVVWCLRHYLHITALIIWIDIIPSSQPTSSLTGVPPSQQPSLPSRTILPTARVPRPIPDDFDFKKFVTIRPTAVTKLNISLASCIRMNVRIEKANNDSITKTIGVKSADMPHPDDMDIGLTLEASYITQLMNYKNWSKAKPFVLHLDHFP